MSPTVAARKLRPPLPPEAARHPLVYGEWLDAPGKLTLLFYGHYDAQSVEPVEFWRHPPFERTVEPCLLRSRLTPRLAAEARTRRLGARPAAPLAPTGGGTMCRKMSKLVYS
jgi:hypothetical protein